MSGDDSSDDGKSCLGCFLCVHNTSRKGQTDRIDLPEIVRDPPIFSARHAGVRSDIDTDDAGEEIIIASSRHRAPAGSGDILSRSSDLDAVSRLAETGPSSSCPPGTGITRSSRGPRPVRVDNNTIHASDSLRSEHIRQWWKSTEAVAADLHGDQDPFDAANYDDLVTEIPVSGLWL